MTHVVYNKDTTRLLNKVSYATRSAAKAGLTRAAKADCTLIKADYDVAEIHMFHNFIEKQVTKTNMMSGKQYEERANTPISCSPASETYWSM
jgi:phosphopantetheinyl transferase (holo-ACP synthase)